jgi:hypothetical protein
MPDHPTYHSQILDHLSLIAGMFNEPDSSLAPSD